jgi:hypothetical protein
VLCYFTALGLSNPLLGDELNVGKVCPVTQQQTVLGHLVLSTPWYHDSSGNAAYIARDNAIGVGIDIHSLVINQVMLGITTLRNVINIDYYKCGLPIVKSSPDRQNLP